MFFFFLKILLFAWSPFDFATKKKVSFQKISSKETNRVEKRRVVTRPFQFAVSPASLHQIKSIFLVDFRSRSRPRYHDHEICRGKSTILHQSRHFSSAILLSLFFSSLSLTLYLCPLFFFKEGERDGLECERRESWNLVCYDKSVAGHGWRMLRNGFVRLDKVFVHLLIRPRRNAMLFFSPRLLACLFFFS